jgi:hypothetical protein
MQCPICGYEGIAEEACFCPHCRYQFLEPESEIFESPPHFTQQRWAGTTTPADGRFSKKEIHQMEIQLLQPAILLMLAIAAVSYIAIGRMPELAVRISTVEIPCGGFLSLFIGAVIAWIFYRIVLFRIQ